MNLDFLLGVIFGEVVMICIYYFAGWLKDIKS